MKPVKTLLIANRGEIAVRIIHTANKMGIYTITVFSEQDRHALHTSEADESLSLGWGSIRETYLNIGKIMELARQGKADAIHPGYGFLAENPEFPKACEENGITFIGPSAEAIRVMGNKTEAGRFVSGLNIPIPHINKGTQEELSQEITDEDFPVIIKAAAGGGGKGMRIVREKEHLKEALKSTAREAYSYFGDDTVYIEKYFENPKHIEIQILGDQHGNYVHLFERECSVQRRHQKILEESPSPTLDDTTRREMGNAAVKIARAINYTGAGTVEFLIDENINFYFLEMNTRIQVEHPVTEMITNTDLISEQLRIAEGRPMRWNQENINFRGHAIEARIYAENPENDFLPVSGTIRQLVFPKIKGIRIDSGITDNSKIPPEYDPLIAKIVAWNDNRTSAIDLLRKGLDQTIIMGVRHNLNYLKTILMDESFRNNRFTTRLIDHNHKQFIETITGQREQTDTRLLIAAYIFLQSINRKKNTREHVWNHLGYWQPYMEWSLTIGNQECRFNFTRNNRMLILHPESEAFRAELSEIHDGYLVIGTKESWTTVYYTRIDKSQTDMLIHGHLFQLFDRDYQEITAQKKHIHKESQNGEPIKSPMFGKVLDIRVKEDMVVKKGQTLAIVEAMKTENNILAPYDTKIKHIAIKEGEQVKDGQIIMETYFL
ncbi:MAG: biotin carboxylase N-terminal domain-containing protein [Bacteroidales bacterium]